MKYEVGFRIVREYKVQIEAGSWLQKVCIGVRSASPNAFTSEKRKGER